VLSTEVFAATHLYTMPAHKLTYFNGRGRGEIIRLVFAAADVAYEDVRIDRADWPGTHKAGTPFGQLPVLEVDGVKLCQSNACARYVARKYNLAGKTDLDQAKVDMIVDCMEDTSKPIIKIFLEKDEAKKAELKKKYLDEELPAYLTYLENILKTNQGGDKFFVGTELTLADLALINLVSWTAMAGATDPLAKFPKLAALQKRAEAVPKVAAWLAKRPKTDF